MAIKVTVEDLESGEITWQIRDYYEDYILVSAAPCYLASRTEHTDGTHTLVVKGASRPSYNNTITYDPPVVAE